MKKILVFLSLGFILMVGYSVRSYNLTIWPREGATFDEFAWSWLGISLLDNGVPMSWSRHQPYKFQTDFVNNNKTSFVLSTPYLEHPPLFGFITGIFAKLSGATTFDTVKINHIRPLALFLGVLSIFAVFLLTSSVFGVIIGLLASSIYAVFPTVVVGSRILQNENFFIPFFLISLWLTNLYINNKTTGQRSWFMITILVLCFVLPLAKIPWIAAPISIFFLFLVSKKYTEALSVFLITLLSIFTYCLWGWRWDWEVFIGLMKLQTARYDMSFDGFLALVTTPLVTDRIYTDGWIYFGWISVFLLAVNNWKKSIPILIGFLSYLLIYLLGIPNEPGHGWYRYPFYPFLAIAIAWGIKKYLLDNPFFSFSLFTVVGLPLFEHLWVPKFGFSYFPYRVYITMTALTSLFCLTGKNKYLKTTGMVCTVAFLIALLYLSYRAGLRYNEQ